MAYPVFDLHCDTADRIGWATLDLDLRFTAGTDGYFPGDETHPQDFDLIEGNACAISLAKIGNTPWAQCFATFVPDEIPTAHAARFQAQIMAHMSGQAMLNHDRMVNVRSAADIRPALKDGKVACIHTIENATFFAEDPALIEVLKSLIRERFDVDVQVDSGRILYQETIAAPVEGVGHFEPLRHYAEVHLLLEPAERGTGLTFDTACSEDVLDRNWQRLILTHLAEKCHRGVLTGAPLTDVKITLLAGRAHVKHTEGGDFRQATWRAVRQGLMQAESVLLEPYYAFRIEVPAEQIGRAISDVRLMSGTFSSPETHGDMAVLTGRAPVATMRDYPAEVAAYTRGRGRISCSVAGYDTCHNAQEVIAESGYDPARDLDNTPDSVFCAHGAGTVIPWDRVRDYMHIDTGFGKAETQTPPPAPRMFRRRFDLDDRELEEILQREFGPIRRAQYAAPVRNAAPGADETERAELFHPRRERVIVDGYNVIFAWDELRALADSGHIDAARERLMDALSNYAAFTRREVVVVFDGYRVPGGQGEKFDRSGLHVVFTRQGETADAYMEKLADEIGKNESVRVVTSDALIQLSALRSGVLRVSAAELERELERTNGEIAAVLRRLREEARHAAGQESPLRALDPKSNPDKEEPI